VSHQVEEYLEFISSCRIVVAKLVKMSGIDINKELLIALIEERPVLWDKCDDAYKDRNATKEAWNEVCTGLKEDFEILKDSERNVFGK
jgi:hypothetical protein